VSRVFWDTNLFVYFLEDTGTLADQVDRVRRAMLERNDHLVTSSLTLGELLVKPLQAERHDLARQYEQLLASSAEVVEFGTDAARVYAAIRATRPLKAPDAIQLACAASAKVDLFITNDDRLSRVVVPGIHFISSLERAFL
jgi:uncharacterized protein